MSPDETIPGNEPAQTTTYASPECATCGAAPGAPCLPQCDSKPPGRIRHMPEVHCRCGTWSTILLSGRETPAQAARAMGWQNTRRAGWMCEQCQGAK